MLISMEQIVAKARKIANKNHWNFMIHVVTVLIMFSAHLNPDVMIVSFHASEIRGLCCLKCSSEMLETLPYFWNLNIPTYFWLSLRYNVALHRAVLL